MLNIRICAVKRLCSISFDADLSECAALAVSSYVIDEEKLKGLMRVLTLKFDDIAVSGGNNAFDFETAMRIKYFVDSLPDNTDTLFVCCDSGESRSSAMAAAVMRYKGEDEMTVWSNPQYHPNVYVYAVLCKALGVEAAEKEIADKAEINRLAFITAKG